MVVEENGDVSVSLVGSGLFCSAARTAVAVVQDDPPRHSDRLGGTNDKARNICNGIRQ